MSRKEETSWAEVGSKAVGWKGVLEDDDDDEGEDGSREEEELEGGDDDDF